MIGVNTAHQVLECGICGEALDITPATAKNPAALRKAIDSMAEEHQPCEQYQDKPARAQAERQYTVRMRALMRGLHDEQSKGTNRNQQ